MFGSRWLLETGPIDHQSPNYQDERVQGVPTPMSRDHPHSQHAGHAPGLGLQTRYMESYQPSLATVLAAALMVNEVPQFSDVTGAVAEER